MAKIQSVEDIFRLWGSVAEMAKAIGFRADTVRKWRKEGEERIPQSAWRAVIDAAVLKDVVLTVEDIMAVNKPMKPRGRKLGSKTHKRSEARVVG